jgi:putative membrane protein
MMGSGMMELGLIWVLVLLVGLVVLVVWVVRLLFPQSTAAQEQDVGDESALEIAKRRYARGEITAEEFARLKRDLT